VAEVLALGFWADSPLATARVVLAVKLIVLIGLVGIWIRVSRGTARRAES
jgi:hypothetical protein